MASLSFFGRLAKVGSYAVQRDIVPCCGLGFGHLTSSAAASWLKRHFGKQPGCTGAESIRTGPPFLASSKLQATQYSSWQQHVFQTSYTSPTIQRKRKKQRPVFAQRSTTSYTKSTRSRAITKITHIITRAHKMSVIHTCTDSCHVMSSVQTRLSVTDSQPGLGSERSRVTTTA